MIIRTIKIPPALKKIEKAGAYILLGIASTLGIFKLQNVTDETHSLAKAVCEAQNTEADRLDGFLHNLYSSTTNAEVKKYIFDQFQKSFPKVDCSNPK